MSVCLNDNVKTWYKLLQNQLNNRIEVIIRMKISEAFEKGIIPKEYEGVFPLKCSCGADIEISETLTKMWCPSERCTHKQIARMCKMLQAFGVKDIGESYCEELWECLELYGLDSSYMNVFLLPLHRYPYMRTNEFNLKRFKSIQQVVKDSVLNNNLTFSDLIFKMSLPGLGSNAYKLCDGFANHVHMIKYANLKYKSRSMYNLICSRFGYGVTSKNILNTLVQFNDDIILAEKIFSLRPPVGRVIKVAITGRIKNVGKYTRNDFLKYCNELCGDKAMVVDAPPSNSIEFVVADEESNSSTYSYGEDYNILIDSKEFISWLRNEVLNDE